MCWPPKQAIVIGSVRLPYVHYPRDRKFNPTKSRQIR